MGPSQKGEPEWSLGHFRDEQNHTCKCGILSSWKSSYIYIYTVDIYYIYMVQSCSTCIMGSSCDVMWCSSTSKKWGQPAKWCNSCCALQLDGRVHNYDEVGAFQCLCSRLL